tara:strand:+ start:3167 stop:4075 length:909 start_codon:yes stop_codon:yes gene_type:complete
MKSTFLDIIQELDDESPEGVYLEFLLQYRFNDLNFHFFFEGYEDPSFYNGLLESIIKEDSFQYIGKGKYKLYQLHQDIDWGKYNKNRVLFFTDRDYTELIGESLLKDENIYITDYYSIENHIVNEEVLDRILREIFHISSIKKRAEAKSKFKIEYNKFFRAISYLIAWIVYIKRNNIKVTLNEIDLGKLFRFSKEIDFKARGGKQTEYLEKITGVTTPENSWGDILKIINEIRTMNPKVVIRGKFEIWFFIQFLIEYKDSLAKPNKVNTHLTNANCIEICAPRVIMPESLVRFIHENYGKIH